MRSTPRPALRVRLALTLALAAGGCLTTAPVYDTGEVYYGEGPEQAIAAADGGLARGTDPTLVTLDKAVALLEIGDYEQSAGLLGACATPVDVAPEAAKPTKAWSKVNDPAAPYRLEGFERVYVHTLAMADRLALQDVAAAAAEAELALATIDNLGCDACTFPFTRYLAAVTFEALGDPVRAFDVLAEAVAENPGLPLLDEELQRMADAEPCPAVDDPGDPLTPNADSRRILYVVLLLGRGPVKVPNAARVPWSDVMPWPSYQERWPPGTGGAILLAAGGHGREAEPLNDMLALAQASLSARLGHLLARETGSPASHQDVTVALDLGHLSLGMSIRALLATMYPTDLRHWSTLPATCQVIRAAVDAVDRCDLVYLGPDGEPVDREVLELPPEWESGPLFVTRRMP